MAGSIQYKGLDAVTATGAGLPRNYQTPRAKHSLQILHTGSPTAVKATLLGSLDGTNFSVIATWDSADGRSSGDIVTVSDCPVIATKVSLDTLTAGTSPTVTALVNSQDAQ